MTVPLTSIQLCKAQASLNHTNQDGCYAIRLLDGEKPIYVPLNPIHPIGFSVHLDIKLKSPNSQSIKTTLSDKKKQRRNEFHISMPSESFIFGVITSTIMRFLSARAIKASGWSVYENNGQKYLLLKLGRKTNKALALQDTINQLLDDIPGAGGLECHLKTY